MTTTPDNPGPRDDAEHTPAGSEDAAGVEVGMSEGEGSTFEPEEDPEGHG